MGTKHLMISSTDHNSPTPPPFLFRFASYPSSLCLAMSDSGFISRTSAPHAFDSLEGRFSRTEAYLSSPACIGLHIARASLISRLNL
jgi:hypothetical protein